MSQCAMHWDVLSTDVCPAHNEGGVYATVMQGRGGAKVWLCYSSRDRRKVGG